VALHFLVTQQPKSETLPTVRFVPDLAVRSTAVAIRPSDLWLLLLRVLMILLIGAAFAQPRITPTHRTIARILAVDVSRDVGDAGTLKDSAMAYAPGARALILFNSTTHSITGAHMMDSLAAATTRRGAQSGQRGSLSSALIASYRAAAHVRAGVDSLELVVVSPFLAEERDAATATIRSLWPGHIVAVHVTGTSTSTQRQGQPTGHARIAWADSTSDATHDGIWKRRTRIDTMGAVRAGNTVLVYPLARRWELATHLDSTTRVYARWVDGTPAAVERLIDGKCTRFMGFAVPSVGDVMLRPAFRRFADELAVPCSVARNPEPLPVEYLAAFAGPANRVPVALVKPPIARMTSWVPWLLGGALALALLELLVRWMTAQGSASDDESAELNVRDAMHPSGARGVARTESASR